MSKNDIEKIALEIREIKSQIGKVAKDPVPSPKGKYTLEVEDGWGKSIKKPLRNLTLKKVNQIVNEMNEANYRWEEVEYDFRNDEETEEREWELRELYRKELDPKNWYSLLTGGYDAVIITDSNGNSWQDVGGEWEFYIR